MTEKTYSGTVAIMGPPNAGKSTLLNRLLGQKLAIVSPRVQTTRVRLLGVLTEGNRQFAFVDTPGIFTPEKAGDGRAKASDRSMLRHAWDGADGADIMLLLLDATEKSPLGRHRDMVEALLHKRSNDPEARPLYVALNKTDAIAPAVLLPLAQRVEKELQPAAIFMISARGGEGVDALKKTIGDALPQRDFQHDPEMLTDAVLRDLATEFTREQLFLQLRHELPYDATVTTDTWEDFDNGSVKITQSITVMKESQKGIVIGKGGAQLKAIGEAARIQIAELVDQPVHLKLHVKILTAR